jgi:hypothetical protein
VLSPLLAPLAQRPPRKAATVSADTQLHLRFKLVVQPTDACSLIAAAKHPLHCGATVTSPAHLV